MRHLILFCVVAVLSTHAATITLEWQPNVDDVTTGYNVYGVAGGATNLVAHVEGVQFFTSTFTVPNDRWTFYVTAVGRSSPTGEIEESDPSDPLVVLLQPPPAPQLSPPQVAYEGAQRYSVAIVWDAVPTEYYAGYEVELKRDNTSVSKVSTRLPSAVFSQMLTGGYSVSVTATNTAGASSVSGQAFAIAKPGKPKNTQVKID